jgi:drug/metabolite transporter (DMT)-like permease
MANMSRRGWLLFGIMSLIWGIPYLLIRVALRELAPPTLVFARTFPAAVLLIPLAVHRGDLRRALARWQWVVAFAVVEMAIPWLFLSRAEQRLSSSASGLLIAAVPLLAALIYRLSPHTDRLTGRRLMGLVIGFAGVAVVVGVNVGHADVLAVLEVGVVALGYTLGPLIVSRRLDGLPSLGVVAVAVGLTAMGYAPVALTHLPAHHHLGGEEWASVAGLSIVCTALAFVLFFALISEVGPSRSTVITYVNPAVAVLLGVTVLGEPFTAGIAAGFPLIILGSVLATGTQTAMHRWHRLRCPTRRTPEEDGGMPKTPAEKLGIKPGNTLSVLNAPNGEVAVVGPLPDRVTVAPPGSTSVSAADVVVLFAADSTQLHRDAPAVLTSVPDSTRVWIAYQKGGASDLSRDTLMPAFTSLGWHGVSLAALDDRWSAARFRRMDQIGRNRAGAEPIGAGAVARCSPPVR